MINWKCPEDDKTEIFEKTNKHYMTFEAHDVGTISCIRWFFKLPTQNCGNQKFRKISCGGNWISSDFSYVKGFL